MAITVTAGRRWSPPNDLPAELWDPGAPPLGSTSYTVPAGAVWFGTGGSDTTGDGTQVSPYASLAKAFQVIGQNGTIVGRGEHHLGGPQYTAVGAVGLGQQMLFPYSGITIMNWPGEQLAFDGSVVVTGFTADSTSVPGKTVWRAPFAQTVNRAPTQVRGEASSGWGNFVHQSFPIAHWCEQAFLDGEQLQQVQTLAEVGPGQFFVEGAAPASGGYTNDFTSTHYVIGDNPAGHEVRISNLSRFLGVNKTGCSIRGAAVRRYNPSLCDWGAIFVSSGTGQSFTMEDGWVEDISTLGLKIDGHDSVIRRMTIQRCGQEGIGNNSDRLLVEHCVFRDNVNRRFIYGPDAGAIKTNRGHNQVIRYNHFDHNYGHGWWGDQSHYQCHVYGNLFTDNYGIAVLAEIGDSTLIVGNMIVSNGVASTDMSGREPYLNPAIRISASNRCKVWHNTIVNPEKGIQVNQDPRTPYGSGYPAAWDPRYDQAWHEANCSWNITQFDAGNNLFVDCAGLNAVQSGFWSVGSEALDNYGISTRGHVYVKTASNRPTRFATAFPDGTSIKVYLDLNATGGGTYDPTISWKNETGEIGSGFGIVASPWQDAATYRPTSAVLAMATPAAVPADVQALLDICPWNRLPIGAGYLN